jgi:hypothetical protein
MAGRVRHAFLPVRHRPKLPMGSYGSNEDPELTRISFQHVAWHVYWTEVFKIADHRRVDVLQARVIFHATGKLPARRAEREKSGDESYWSCDDLLVAFMLQFEPWQNKMYDLDRVHEMDRTGMPWEVGKNNAEMTLALFVTAVDNYTRSSLPSFLRYANRFDDMKSLFDDPIFGDDMKFEYESHQRMQQHQIDEMLRIAQSHPRVQEIDGIIRRGSPSIYSVHYPYPPHGEWAPGSVVFHNVPNCMCFMADGGALLRLEVLDTERLSRYKLAELKKPWWNGQYDFDFPHFNIREGTEFDHDALLTVLRHGVERICARHGVP